MPVPPDYSAYERLIRITDRLAFPGLLIAPAAAVASMFIPPMSLTRPFYGFAGVLVLAVVLVALQKIADRMLARLDADLYRLPWDQVESLAYVLFARHARCCHSPSDFEHAARVWLARGYLELPDNADLSKTARPLRLPNLVADAQ